MSIFSVKIDLGNAAMQHPDDVAACLRDIARKIEGEPFFHASVQKIRDDNGNTVGTFWRSGR